MDSFRCLVCREIYLRSINAKPDFDSRQIYNVIGSVGTCGKCFNKYVPVIPMRYNVVTKRLEDVGMPIYTSTEIVLRWFNTIDCAKILMIEALENNL